MAVVKVEHRGRTWELDDTHEAVRWVISELPTWEPDTFGTIDEYVNGGVFVDVGAWVGLFTLYAAPTASWVYAIEPDPVAYSLLAKHCAANHIDNVTLIPGAVWDSNGFRDLHTYSDCWGDSMSGFGRAGGLAVEVKTYTPADIRSLINSRIDLVKVDVEGAESEIVPGLLEWGVPMHVSLHMNEMSGPIDWQNRQVEPLTVHSGYPTVMVR